MSVLTKVPVVRMGRPLAVVPDMVSTGAAGLPAIVVRPWSSAAKPGLTGSRPSVNSLPTAISR